MTTSKEYCDVICDAIDTYGREAQTDMCIEECSELIKALLKFRRLPLEERLAAKGMKVLEIFKRRSPMCKSCFGKWNCFMGMGARNMKLSGR